jgi:hypothetical protein
MRPVKAGRVFVLCLPDLAIGAKLCKMRGLSFTRPQTKLGTPINAVKRRKIMNLKSKIRN